MKINVDNLANELDSASKDARELERSHTDAIAKLRSATGELGREPVSSQGYLALRLRLETQEIMMACALRDYTAVLADCVERHRATLLRCLPERGSLDTCEIERDITSLKTRLSLYESNYATIAYRLQRGAYSEQSLEDGSAMRDFAQQGWLADEIACIKEAIRLLQDKIVRIGDYERDTAHIYDALDDLTDAMNAGYACLGDLTLQDGYFIPSHAELANWLCGFALARFFHDGAFDWQAIEASLAKTASDITDTEYFALSAAFSQMGAVDMARFIQALAEPRGDVRYNPLSDSEPYRSWGFDPAKVESLSAAMVAVYYTALPELANDLPALGRFCFRMGIISALPSLGSSAGLGLTGPPDAERPPISITLNDGGGFDLAYKGAFVTPSLPPAYAQHYTTQVDYRLTVSGGKTIEDTADILDTWLNGRHLNVLNFGLNDAASFGFSIISTTSHTLGPAASVAGLGLGAYSQRDRLRLSNDLLAYFDYSRDINQIYSPLGCYAVTTSSTEFDSLPQLVVMKGPGTDGTIGLLHAYLPEYSYEGIMTDKDRYLTDISEIKKQPLKYAYVFNNDGSGSPPPQ